MLWNIATLDGRIAISGSLPVWDRWPGFQLCDQALSTDLLRGLLDASTDARQRMWNVMGHSSDDDHLDFDGRPATLHERLTGHHWDASYQGDVPPWDVGRPHDAVVHLADHGAFHGNVLDVGCGTGENALELARRGLDVWGVDVAPTAIAQAKAKARTRNLEVRFVVGDALDLAQLGKTFDSVLDCGLFHTLDDAERARYVESLASVVSGGGTLHLQCFSDQEPGDGGPRRVDRLAGARSPGDV